MLAEAVAEKELLFTMLCVIRLSSLLAFRALALTGEFMKKSLMALSLVVASVSTAFAQSNDDETSHLDRVTNATQVIKDLAGPGAQQDLAIPSKLIDRAKCVVVIPQYKKGGFVVAAGYGAGLALCRDNTGALANPQFINLIGGSYGFQAGVQITDMVLLMLNPDAPQQLLHNGGFKLGAEGSIALGPIGRDAYAGSNTDFQDETLEYASSRGIFGGVSLNGSKLSLEKNAQAESEASPEVMQALSVLEAELKAVQD
jgi:SH3 domain-containing YSC84-like protein 1